MKPIDRFSYLKNNRCRKIPHSGTVLPPFDYRSEALSLYLYTISFWDNGRKEYLFQVSSIISTLDG